MPEEKYVVIKITKAARLATDYGELGLDECLSLVSDLNRDALENGMERGTDDRYIPDWA